jgi:hypothetical protein
METNCQELVKLWQAGNNQRSSISVIVREIRDLSSFPQEFSLIYVSRLC